MEARRRDGVAEPGGRLVQVFQQPNDLQHHLARVRERRVLIRQLAGIDSILVHGTPLTRALVDAPIVQVTCGDVQRNMLRLAPYRLTPLILRIVTVPSTQKITKAVKRKVKPSCGWPTVCPRAISRLPKTSASTC